MNLPIIPAPHGPGLSNGLCNQQFNMMTSSQLRVNLFPGIFYISQHLL
jgi:hypothetical protein